MPKIFVTYKIPSSGIKLLKAQRGFIVREHGKKPLISRKELLRSVQGVDAILCLLTEKIDAEVLDAAGKQLKIVANMAVGYENIDLKAAAIRRVVVTNTPGVLTEAVAEHTIALILAVARRVVESDGFLRAGKYTGWRPELLLGTELKGKTLGIIGLGRIGFSVAEKTVGGLGMQIVYHDVKPNPDFEKRFHAKFLSLEELLRTSDIVSLHVPLLSSTHHLIDGKRLRLMKKTAYLVNTSRGPIVDEKALAVALRRGEIAGAALDVFEFEPKPVASLLKLKNTVLTPHVASATTEARDAMSKLAAENIVAVLSGAAPLTPVGGVGGRV